MIGDRESECNVANQTDSHQQQGAGVDGGEEDEGGKGAQETGHIPLHAWHGLVNLERKGDQEEQVGDGQIEEQDVCWICLDMDLDTEGIESQEVGWEANHEGNYVHRENHLAAHHCVRTWTKGSEQTSIKM